MRLTVRGGRVVDPANGVDRVTDLHVAKGRVAALGQPPDGFAADRVIEAGGLVVCPGLVDLRARLREPGLESPPCAVRRTPIRSSTPGRSSSSSTSAQRVPAWPGSRSSAR